MSLQLKKPKSSTSSVVGSTSTGNNQVSTLGVGSMTFSAASRANNLTVSRPHSSARSSPHYSGACIEPPPPPVARTLDVIAAEHGLPPLPPATQGKRKGNNTEPNKPAVTGASTAGLTRGLTKGSVQTSSVASTSIAETSQEKQYGARSPLTRCLTKGKGSFQTSVAPTSTAEIFSLPPIPPLPHWTSFSQSCQSSPETSNPPPEGSDDGVDEISAYLKSLPPEEVLCLLSMPPATRSKIN